MPKVLQSVLALGLALTPVSAFAQSASAPAAEPTAIPPAPIDPARLEAAKLTVDRVFPAGTYARIMDGSMNTMMSKMMDSMGKLPMRDLAAMGGMSEQDLAKMGPGTLAEIMAIYDPAYHQRMDITMKTMMHEMSGMMTQLEPGVRDGLGRAYARHFTAAQLADLNQFFATPSGSAYARDSMMMFMDPEVMAQMQAFVPQLMKAMPTIAQKLETATAELPKPRKYKDLNQAERAKLAKLLGLTEAELRKQQHQ